MTIHDHGYWIGECAAQHLVDLELADALVEQCREKTVLDAGCGPGDYVRHLRSAGIDAHGYDGNPDTEALTAGLCGVANLAVPFQAPQQYDVVLSLEVLEHIPEQYEQIALDNLVKQCRYTLIVSWASPGQGGTGHINEQPQIYVREQIESRGFEFCPSVTCDLREAASLPWFRRNLLAYQRC